MKNNQKLYSFLNNFKHSLFFTLFGYSSSCKQDPSCSKYTALQIKKNGTIVGFSQGLWRVLHCR